MRSRANFRGHPIHAMLVPFPLALLVGGFVADIGATAVGNPDLLLVAWYLVAGGLVMGLVAAVPGLIDYVATVPPQSTAKRRATRHLTANLTALVLFAGAWLLRGGPSVAPEPVLLAAEGLGTLLLGIGGWMGGTLTFRNQIGVDHRHAGAGKWSEARLVADADGWVIAARVGELEPNQMKLLRVNGRRIALARTESGWAAFEDRCTHRGGPLADGVLACETVTCPWHGSQFDIRTGQVSAGPATAPISTFPIEVLGDQVRIDISSP